MSTTHKCVHATGLKSRVTIIGAVINLFLAAVKIGFGFLGQSSSLIADGIHSLSDLISDFFVLIAVKLGSREADVDHPYGHRRFETMATVVLGLALIMVAGGIAWDAIERVFAPDMLLNPSKETLGIAAISILANEWLYQYTRRIATITRSKLLMANAWHHRSDALSSVIVLFGIGAVFYGYWYADAVAAIIVSIMVAKIGINLVSESLRELVDTSLPKELVHEIRQFILSHDDIQDIHLLRTRQMGEDAFIDAHIVVAPKISVSEGHMISDNVRDNLMHKFDDVIDVLVHVDPEDDQLPRQKAHPPTRKHINSLLQHILGSFFQEIDRFYIHYIEGMVELDIILNLPATAEAELTEIKTRITHLEKREQKIRKITVFIKP